MQIIISNLKLVYFAKIFYQYFIFRTIYLTNNYRRYVQF